MKPNDAFNSLLRQWRPILHKVRVSPTETLDFFWGFSRRFFFTLTFFSLFTAKILHLYAHLNSIPRAKFVAWGITFFFQDVIILLFFRIFVQRLPWRPVAMAAALIVIPFRYEPLFFFFFFFLVEHLWSFPVF